MKLALAIILCLTCLTASAENRFKVVYEQDPLGNQAKIIEDTKTGKQYLWYSFGLVEMEDEDEDYGNITIPDKSDIDLPR